MLAAAYNLGTVFYSHAVAQQNEAEDSQSTASSDASQVWLILISDLSESHVQTMFRLCSSTICNTGNCSC